MIRYKIILGIGLALTGCSESESTIGKFGKTAKFPLYYLVNGASENSGVLYSVPKVTVGEVVTSDVVATGFNSPGGMGQDSAGNIYVAETLPGAGGKIRKIRANTHEVTDLILNLDNPTGVVVDSFNQVYVIENGQHRILRLDGGRSFSVFKDTEMSSPESGSMDVADNLYLVESGESAVSKISPSGQRELVTPLLQGVVDATFDSSGVVHVLTVDRETNVGRVLRVLDRETVEEIATDLVNPMAIAFDAFNVLYIAEGAPLNRISRQVIGNETRRIIVNTVGEPQALLFTPF